MVGLGGGTGGIAIYDIVCVLFKVESREFVRDEREWYPLLTQHLIKSECNSRVYMNRE